MSEHRHRALIENQDDIGAYIPPDHQDTVNVRLVDGDFCGRFEMNLGVVQPGGEAEPHLHETEHQVMYVLDGEMRGHPRRRSPGDLRPGDGGPDPAEAPPPGGGDRRDSPMRAIVLYSPPLGPRNESPGRAGLSRAGKLVRTAPGPIPTATPARFDPDPARPVRLRERRPRRTRRQGVKA